LSWLHTNPDEAGLEYERIRRLLIARFKSHNGSSPETLADQTIDRVSKTLTTEMIDHWDGKKEKYFHRVGFYILLEDKNRRAKETALLDDLNVPIPLAREDSEQALSCLDTCLRELSEPKRHLITRYYRGKSAEKIKNRRELAKELSLDLPALRVQAHRIRKDLLTCMTNGLEEVPTF
jgi:DNA-directed RNA polymerase specialized sigma24 family protein